MIRNEILREEGILYAGQWEPIYFVKQNGGRNHTNLQAFYDFQRSEPYVEHLASMGVNQLWGNFFKGYGLTFEDAEQRRIARLIEICHKHGIRYVSYVTFGTLTLETLAREQPEARNWIVRPDTFVRASYFGYQNFRARVDYSSDEYVDYILRVVDKALDLGSDGIHFDNAEMAIGFEACRCDRCKAKFRAWLDERYGERDERTRAAGQARYGMNDFSAANAPWFTLGQHPVNQRELHVPHQQDWVQFRCDLFAAAAKRLSDRIRSRGALVEFNFGKGDNINNQYYRGVDYERLYPLADTSFHEGVMHAGLNRHGTPICAIREYKNAQAFGLPLMTYCKGVIEQAMAFAFNPCMIGTARPGMDEPRRRMFEFFRKYQRYSTHAESLANVAVLRHRLSMAFDSYAPYLAASAVEQVLQEAHVPFNIVAASHLGDLTRYAVLIIPAMRYMTDGEIEKVSAWVRSGGGLMLVGEVATKNELNQFRSGHEPVRTIEEFLAGPAIRSGFAELVGREMNEAFVVPVGQGQVGYLPHLKHVDVPGTEIADWTVTADHVNAPRNARQVLEMVRSLLSDREILRVQSPKELVTDFCKRMDTGEGVIHLVNVGYECAPRRLPTDANPRLPAGAINTPPPAASEIAPRGSGGLTDPGGGLAASNECSPKNSNPSLPAGAISGESAIENSPPRERGVGATVAFRWAQPVQTVRVLRYDQDEEILPVTRDGDWQTVRVEGIREHAVIVL